MLEVVEPGSAVLTDLAPAGITVKAEDEPVAVAVSSIKVLRDIFYIGAVGFGRRGEIRDEPILEFPLESDQFFVLGDNSAASKDGRLWIDVHYVDRRLLLGRAISIVWPHMVPASRHVTVTLPVLGRVAIALMAKLREDEVYSVGQVACLPDGHEVKSRTDHVTAKS